MARAKRTARAVDYKTVLIPPTVTVYEAASGKVADMGPFFPQIGYMAVMIQETDLIYLFVDNGRLLSVVKADLAAPAVEVAA